MLDTNPHPLARRIEEALPHPIAARFHICAADEIPSTNTRLKEIAADAVSSGKPIVPTVLLARTQSGGRGRLGRTFHSPSGTGLYMSMLLTPTLQPKEALCLTTAAAAACAEAADAVRTDADIESRGIVGIKWVNDLYLGGKKICGILAEAALTPNADALSWAVIGIGINLLPPKEGFPAALADTAGTLLEANPTGDADDLLSRLAADILCRLIAYLDPAQKDTVLSIYRERSILDGRAVLVRPASSLGGEELPAQVLGIDDDFGLTVRYEDGREAVLSSGEVVLCDDGTAPTHQSSRASVHLL